MDTATFTLESLARLGTCVLHVDESNRTVWASERLKRFIGSDCIGKRFDDLVASSGRALISLSLRINGNGVLPLRGDWLSLEGARGRIFIGSPAPQTFDEMTSLGIGLDDYPENDSWLNYLIKADESISTQKDAVERIEHLKQDRIKLTEARDQMADARKASLNMMLDLEQARAASEKAKTELEEINRKLELRNRAMTGREKRIVELKARINDLHAELDLDDVYGKDRSAAPGLDGLRNKRGRDQEAEQLDLETTLTELGKLQGLLESFCESVGIAAAIVDLNGDVLVGARWQRICTAFHRENPNTRRKCIESDTVIANQLQEGTRFSIYTCKNGLTDAASPIIVGGRHVANLFVGQFLLEAPDVAYFREQAVEHGFPQEEYLEALADVPVLDRAKLEYILNFLSEFAVLLGSMGVGHSSLSRMNEDLRDNREALLSLMEDLIEAREKAEQYASRAEDASRSKSEFLANMSHEIRTPMTAILGYTETMLESDISESERLNALYTVQRNGLHLLQILNDILDISKIEAGKIEIERVRCSPIQVAADVKALMQVRADAKNLPFDIEFDGPVPETIQTDPTRLKQILVNLVGNAVKFTEAGSVRLATSFIEADSSSEAGSVEPILQFEVIDTGLGMSPEQVSRIFQAFNQADTSTTRKFGGTGLGLMISKRLANMLGGDVTVTSRLGHGSAFRLTVATGPLDGVKMIESSTVTTEFVPDEIDRPVPKDRLALLGCRVLLAEDGPDNQRLIKHVLKKAGAQVTVKENGELAAEAALSARDRGVPFNVILMDMQMPVLDGYDATRLIRSRGYTGLIIALTAHTMEGDRQKCLDAGCDDYAGKPIDRRLLIETIQSRLNLNIAGEAYALASRGAVQRPPDGDPS